MDKNYNDDLEKKSKKKKHHRSRSRSQKKHKRSRSRSQKKKDKKKKQKQHDKHYDRQLKDQKKLQKIKLQDQFKQENNHQQVLLPSKEVLQKQKEKRKQYEQNDKDSYRRRQKDRQSRQKDKKRDKYKQRSDRQHRDRDNKQRQTNDKESYKQKQRQRQKQRMKQTNDKNKDEEKKTKNEKQQLGKGQMNKTEQRSKSKQRRRDNKDREKQRQKDKQRDNDRDKDRYRQRQRERERQRQRQRDRDKQRYRQRDNERQRSRQLQQPSSSNRNYQRYENTRRSRTPQRRRQRQQQQQRQRFRFDSPPKSDQSDISDDPQKMQKLNRTKAQQQLVTSKADKKLYLGNLPPNITSQQLMDMLNVALKKMEINNDVDGDSIISAWISPDGVGHYAFVEFRTAQQATNGLALNGASLFDIQQLKLGRPKQYIEYNKQMLSKFGTDSSIDTILKKVQAIGGQIELQVNEKIIHPPSRIIVLKHIVTVDELAIDEEYQQIMDDVKQMAKRYGDVIKIIIPRPHEVIDLQQVQKRVKGLGYIFIEYRTIQQAIFARKQFIQKQFSARSVACGFFDDRRWNEGQYDICEKVVIQF